MNAVPKKTEVHHVLGGRLLFDARFSAMTVEFQKLI